MDVIATLRKERGKMRITLESGQELLVPLSLFHERPLAPGQALDLDAYDQWLLLRQYRHALDRAVGYLAARARSRHELESRLLRCGYRPATVEMVLYKLEREKLLDDADFARQWVEARSGRTLGKRRIAQELQRKGISRAQAEEALAAVDEDAEAEACRQAAEKLASRYSREASRQGMQKLTQALVRRGFGWEDAAGPQSRLCRQMNKKKESRTSPFCLECTAFCVIFYPRRYSA